MTLKTDWYEADSRFIPGHWQPALLLDLALSRGHDSHRLLRGSGLFHEDILSGQARLSPQQFLCLIDNARRLLDADDSSFLFGQRLLPGHYGPASQALQRARDLRQALDLLQELRALLCPLLAPRLLLDDSHAHLYWLDSCGLGAQRRFLLEASMTAVVAMSTWLAGARLPWRASFAHAEPRYVEQYWVHLGEDLRFGAPLDMLSVPRQYLHQGWPGAALTAGQVARQQALAELDGLGFRAGLLDRLYGHLLGKLRHAPQLEEVARELGMSPATLKRKLRKHDSHYQEQLDLARKHMALYLYQVRGYGNDEVAAYLQFHDATNFRRSFKRWTGLAPSALRALWRQG